MHVLLAAIRLAGMYLAGMQDEADMQWQCYCYMKYPYEVHAISAFVMAKLHLMLLFQLCK